MSARERSRLNQANRLRNAAGFTLVELMISVVLLSVVIIGVMQSMTQQQKTSFITEQVVEVQNNVRAVGALLERELRMAGFMVPNALGVCGLDRTAGSDELYISEIEPIIPDDSRAGTLGARLGASTWNAAVAPPAGAMAAATDGTTVNLNLDVSTSDLDGDTNFFYDNDGNTVPDADFRVGGGFILADMANPGRGTVCGTVRAATPAAITINVRSGQLLPHVPTSDAPEEIVLVPAAHYWVNTNFASGRLERNGDLLANGIDDFQISFFFDVSQDGIIDATEQPGMAGEPVYDPSNEDNSTLEEVRFSIAVRTRATDLDFAATQFGGQFVVLENRVDPTAGARDGFRRRTVTGSVRPRNIGQAGSI